MRYAVNVSRRVPDSAGSFRYEHLFATHERSILDEHKAKLVFKELRSKFKYPAYQIHVTRYEDCGYMVQTASWEGH